VTTVRPRTRIQTEKREIILEAALDVFSTHGFRGATIDQIADAAGMSKPNLLYYFKGKEDIFESADSPLARHMARSLARIGRSVGDPMTGTQRLHPPQARNGARLPARKPALRQRDFAGCAAHPANDREGS
jgi:AcrR family transcriptional regulator